MKTVLSFFILVLLYSCKGFESLNNKIYKAQKQAILESPYKDASWTKANIDAQKDFRLTRLPKLLRNKIYSDSYLQDTLFITESFDALCSDCTSDWMKVMFRDTIYSMRREVLGHGGDIGYRIESEFFTTVFKDPQYKMKYNDLVEVVGKVRNNETWKTDPLKYGSDICADGNHTFVTVLYPNKKIEAIYVRCWIPSFDRDGK